MPSGVTRPLAERARALPRVRARGSRVRVGVRVNYFNRGILKSKFYHQIKSTSMQFDQIIVFIYDKNNKLMFD